MIIKCPVCATIYEKEIKVCTMCRFTELNKIFLSQEDYQEWLKDTVKPFQEMYLKECAEKEKLKSYTKVTEEIQLQHDKVVAVATGNNDYGQCNVYEWRNITAIACGGRVSYSRIAKRWDSGSNRQ